MDKVGLRATSRSPLGLLDGEEARSMLCRQRPTGDDGEGDEPRLGVLPKLKEAVGGVGDAPRSTIHLSAFGRWVAEVPMSSDLTTADMLCLLLGVREPARKLMDTCGTPGEQWPERTGEGSRPPSLRRCIDGETHRHKGAPPAPLPPAHACTLWPRGDDSRAQPFVRIVDGWECESCCFGTLQAKPLAGATGSGNGLWHAPAC